MKSTEKSLPATVKIGWRERICLPQMGLSCVLAKIDTGAKTSALHVSHIHRYLKRGEAHVRFTCYDLQENKHVPMQCDFRIFDERVITDSGGHRQSRMVIVTDLQIGENCWPIELTLTNRSEMRHHMLIGRSAIPKGMLIDAKRSYLTRKKPRIKTHKKPKPPSLG